MIQTEISWNWLQSAVWAQVCLHVCCYLLWTMSELKFGIYQWEARTLWAQGIFSWDWNKLKRSRRKHVMSLKAKLSGYMLFPHLSVVRQVSWLSPSSMGQGSIFHLQREGLQSLMKRVYFECKEEWGIGINNPSCTVSIFYIFPCNECKYFC